LKWVEYIADVIGNKSSTFEKTNEMLSADDMTSTKAQPIK
jgi:hypothetical protein